MNVRLISITQPIAEETKGMTPEEYIVYIARVSSPNQLKNETATRLIRYCVDHGHYSIFEQVDFTVEIITSRAISPQILRHRSACFQEFSQRYAIVSEFEPIELRMQGEKNRQGGEEIYSGPKSTPDAKIDYDVAIDGLIADCDILYQNMVKNGISKETARMILPLCCTTKLYMKNNVRNWLAYLNQRLHKDTQKEHRLIAEEIKNIFIEQFPNISSCFDNFALAKEEHFM
jgi:thymidylate synthase (FAD)